MNNNIETNQSHNSGRYFIDWFLYTMISFLLTTPFFQNGDSKLVEDHDWVKHIFGSLLIGFLFGFLNRIVRELDKLNNKK